MAATRGDVVIRKTRRGRSFTLELYPDPPQISVKSFDEALRLAIAFSRRFSTRVWRVNSDGAFVEVPPDQD